MTTAQYITLTIIIILSYLSGLESQLMRQKDFKGCEFKTDYLYPITTGIWLILHAVATFGALVLAMVGINGSNIYGLLFPSAYGSRMDNIPHLAELFLGSLVCLLYYPIFFAIIYFYGDCNIWIASPVALVFLGLLNQGYGYLIVEYDKVLR